MGAGGGCGDLLGSPQGAAEVCFARACGGASGRNPLITGVGLATINKRQFASRGNWTGGWF